MTDDENAIESIGMPEIHSEIVFVPRIYRRAFGTTSKQLQNEMPLSLDCVPYIPYALSLCVYVM